MARGSPPISARDAFPDDVKRVVAQRAAYLCSRPDCRRLTIGPHSDTNKSVSTGVAAHICAASPGGPRYDPNQSEEERKGIANAIWLCHACSDLIDKDAAKFTRNVLMDWKDKHEALVAAEGGVPTLPNVVLKTKHGLTLPYPGPATLTGNDFKTYREHDLTISQDSRRLLHFVECRIQFPEPIVRYEVVERPLGSTVECKPDRMQLVATASGSGSVTVEGGERPAYDYELAIDKLPSGQTLIVRFYSQQGDRELHTSLRALNEGIVNHIIGSCQRELLGQYLKREFFVALEFEEQAREIRSGPCLDLQQARAQLSGAKSNIIVRQTW